MIKKRLCVILVILICFLLQTTVFQYIKLANVTPNLLLVITVSIGYIYGRTEGIIIGLICGLLSDMFFGNVIGLYGLIYMLIGYFNGYCHKIYFNDDFTIPLMLVAISDFIYGMFYYTFEFLLRGRLNIPFYMLHIILPEMIYSLLLTIVIFKLLSMIDKWFTPKNEEEA